MEGTMEATAPAQSAVVEAVPDEMKVTKAPPKPQTPVDKAIEKVESEQPKPAVHKIKLPGHNKGQGKEEEVTEDKMRRYLNIGPDEEITTNALIKQYTIARDLEYRKNGVDRERIDFENSLNKMKSNFGQFMAEDLGIDPVQWAYQLVRQQEQMAQMHPEDRARMEWHQQLAQREEQLRAIEEQRQQAEYEAEVERYYQTHTKGVAKAIKELGFPQDDLMNAIASFHLEAKIKAGEEVDYPEVAKWTMNKLKHAHAHITSALDGDRLLSYLGDDTVRKVQKALMSKNSKPQPTNQGQVGITYKPQTNKDTKTMSKDEYEDYIKNRIRQLDGR